VEGGEALPAFLPVHIWGVCLQLFSGLNGGQALHWTVRISYLEIYNETFKDLLCLDTPSSSMVIHEEK